MSNTSQIHEIAKNIVKQANGLRLKHAPDYKAHVAYCCYFAQSEKDYEVVDQLVKAIGSVAKTTPTGTVYIIPKVMTDAGELQVFKVRVSDSSRPEIGDADFSLPNYGQLKSKMNSLPEFSLIEREDFEMIELVDEEFDVRAYFSYPPVDEQPYIKSALSKLRQP